MPDVRDVVGRRAADVDPALPGCLGDERDEPGGERIVEAKVEIRPWRFSGCIKRSRECHASTTTPGAVNEGGSAPRPHRRRPSRPPARPDPPA